MKILTFCLSLVLASVVSTSVLSQTTFTGLVDSDYSNPGNWDNGLPAAGNDATIPDGLTAFITASLNVDYNLIVNGIITNNSAGVIITIDGTLYSDGTIDSGQGIINNGVFTNDGDFYLDGTVDNYGDFVNEGSFFVGLSSDGTFNNYNSGTIDNYLYITIFPEGVIYNEGVITNNLTDGLIDNFGVINNMGDFYNDGSVFNGDPAMPNAVIYSCFGNFSGNLPEGFPLQLNFCPSLEICDGLDNDWDGSIDEDCGCTDESGCNFDSTAILDDGSCLFSDACGICGGGGTVAGCTNSTACNYDSTTDCDDGSCLFEDVCGVCGGNSVAGCTDSTACNYDSTATCDDGSCILPDGCTDSTACNYDSTAGCDDGSCCTDGCFEITVAGGTFESEISWGLYSSGQVVGVDVPLYSGGAPASEFLCLAGDCAYQFHMIDSFGDGWNGGTYTIADLATGDVAASGTLATGSDQVDVIALGVSFGCTDPTANNYDPSADCDDGTCITCVTGDTSVTVVMFDSYGDGWGAAVWTITDEASGAVLATGTLAGGATGSDIFCLPDPGSGCFSMEVGGDVFDSEISWELYAQSGSLILSGGAPSGVIGWGGSAGCTDSTACNYDSTTDCDDGSCLFEDVCGVCGGNSVAGCTDSTACNYDSTAGCDDGSCTVDDACGVCGGAGAVAGCMDTTACNYDSLADCDDGSCQTLDACGLCGGAGTVAGCIDSTACNYDSLADCDNGSCQILDACGVCGGAGAVAGCTDSTACNYDSTADCDDGSCLVNDECGNCGGSEIAGCTDSTACNYDQEAGCNDGECLFLDACGDCGGSGVIGCTNSTACNYDSTATCDDGSCVLPDGCTDSTACNYDLLADCDDGGCLFIDACGVCGGIGTAAGCMDSAACNYDSLADCDDGSCTYSGCTDSTAVNFNPNAGCDDGSCILTLGVYNAPDVELNYGDLLELDIFIEDGLDIYAAYASITFDDNVWTLIEGIPGPFLGEQVLISPPIVNGNSIDFGLSKTGPVAGSSGSGLLYTLKFAHTVLPVQIDPYVSLFTSLNIDAYNSLGEIGTLNLPNPTTEINLNFLDDVWPGDCDNSGEVSFLDLLPIGFFYNQTGPSRPNPSIVWIGQPAPLWGTDMSTPSSSYYRVFADGNGDGLINISDQAAIGFNLGQVYTPEIMIIPDNQEDPPAFFSGNAMPISVVPVPSEVTIPDDSSVDISVYVTTDEMNMEDLYGMGLEISFPTDWVSSSDVTLDFSSSDLGIQGIEYLQFTNVTPFLIELAITRTTPMTNFGLIHLFDINIPLDLSLQPGDKEILIDVVASNDQNGTDVVLLPSSGFVNVTNDVIGIDGCTDPTAINYDSLATNDDGSCTYSCAADLSGDGYVDTLDLLIFLVAFDTACQ